MMKDEWHSRSKLEKKEEILAKNLDRHMYARYHTQDEFVVLEM